MAHTAEAQKAISELCIELLRDCRERLTGPEALEDEELVHALRVATKRLRAVWHLVKKLSGAKLARKHRELLRELSAHLSFRRDLAVLEELAGSLAEAERDPKAIQLLERISEILQKEPIRVTCPEELLEEVRRGLDEEISTWEAIDWGVPHHARKVIRRSLRKTSSKARESTKRALDDDSPEKWHEWRKAIKRLRYQREFVAEASGRQPGKVDGRISRLGTALGKRNDLANLLAFGKRKVKSGDLEKEDLNRLRGIIGRAERNLLANCRRQGRRLLRKK